MDELIEQISYEEHALEEMRWGERRNPRELEYRAPAGVRGRNDTRKGDYYPLKVIVLRTV